MPTSISNINYFNATGAVNKDLQDLTNAQVVVKRDIPANPDGMKGDGTPDPFPAYYILDFQMNDDSIEDRRWTESLIYPVQGDRDADFVLLQAILPLTQPGGVAEQVGIQFEDEGANLSTAGTVTEVDFVGAGVSAARVGNKVTVTVLGGGGGGLSAYGYAAAQATTGIGADADVVFDLGASPFPNAGFTSVPAPAGTTFVVATTGDYEFDFMVRGTHAAAATTPLQFALWRNGAIAAVGGNAFEFSSQCLSGVATEEQVVNGHGIIALTAGDTITLHNRTNTVTDAVTVTSIAGGVGAGHPNATLSLKKLN